MGLEVDIEKVRRTGRRDKKKGNGCSEIKKWIKKGGSLKERKS